MRLYLTILAVIVCGTALADCRCPRSAWSANLLIAVDTNEGSIVACGYEDERRHDTVVASEFQVFRCGAGQPLLEFGALQTAILRAESAALHIKEVERWPFGEHWKWVEVPVSEWRLSARDPQPQFRRTLRANPQVTQHEIDAFLKEYKQWLSIEASARSYFSAEKYVARLFTSAVAGDREAKALFLTMSDDAGLDGAAAETYSQAIATYRSWREPGVRLPKE